MFTRLQDETKNGRKNNNNSDNDDVDVDDDDINR